MKPEDLKQAEAVARSLQAEYTPEKDAEIRDRIAREFFGEGGIPPGLYQGWAILEDLRKKRAEVGYPLPPGGVMILGYQSVLAGCLAEMHQSLAAVLGVSVDAIRMSVRKDSRGKPVPAASFTPPDDWVIPISFAGSLKGADRDSVFQEAIGGYVQAAIDRLTGAYWSNMRTRLVACDKIRPELQQPVEPWNDGQADPGR
jgi:hypothetical protein